MGTIICDSACDLWIDQIKDLDVHVIDYDCKLDGKKIKKMTKPEDYDIYYQSMRDGKIATVQPIAKATLKSYLEEFLAKGQDVLFIHSSSALTTSFDVLEEVKQELALAYPDNHLYTYNTLQISMGAGIMVYHAAKLNNKNMPLPQIIKKLDSLKSHIACYFCVSKLDSLKRAEKVAKIVNVSGSMLGVKPILKCDSRGKISKVDTTKGKTGIIKKLVSYLTQLGDNVGDFPIVIMHASCEEEAKALKEAVVKVVGDYSNVWIQPIGTAVGSNAGPDTLALVFRAKHR